MQTMKAIDPQYIEKSLSYQAYRSLVDEHLAEGKTTGPKQSEALTHYTKMNVQRMKRWDKTAKIEDELATLMTQVQEKWIWLILTEGWCGDAAHSVPVIEKLAALNPNIETRYLLRDENLPLMDQYLTNGGRSIPKLIALKADSLEEIGTWGPRPMPAQAMMLAYKQNPEESYEAFNIKIQKWYSQDKGQVIQAEFKELIPLWMHR